MSHIYEFKMTKFTREIIHFATSFYFIGGYMPIFDNELHNRDYDIHSHHTYEPNKGFTENFVHVWCWVNAS